MTDHPCGRSIDRSAQLILHRPAALTAGALRRIHVHLDGHHIADLARDDTAPVSTTEGPHQLSGRCLPLISGEHTFVLAPGEILHLNIYVNALEEIEIDLNEQTTC